MGLFRHFTALLLAILIANPLCCCFAQADAGPGEKPSSCCAHRIPVDEQTPADLPCPGCQAKNPRVADGGKPLSLSFELIELPVIIAHRLDLVPQPQPLSAPAPQDTAAPPPPRLILVLQQRFLI